MIDGLKDRIKGIFSSVKDKAKEDITYEIALDEVPSFIEEHISSKKEIFSAEELSARLKSYSVELREAMVDLENGELRNKNVDKKMINLLEGNKTSYLKKLELLISNLELKEKDDTDNLRDFFKSYKENIERFNKGTTKSFFVIKEFLGDEIKTIAKILKKMDDDILSSERSFESSSNILMGSVHMALVEIKNLKDKRDAIGEEISLIDSSIQKLSKDIFEIEEKASKLKESEESKELSGLKDELESIRSSIKAISSDLKSDLSHIKWYLEKLGERKQLITGYLEDPLSALKGDSAMDIIGLIIKTRTNIERDENPEKIEKLRSYLDSLSEENLRKRKEDIAELDSRKKEVMRKISSSNVGRNISELEYRLDHLKEKLGRKKEEKDSLAGKLEKLDLKPVIKKVEEDLASLLEMDVKIKEG